MAVTYQRSGGFAGFNDVLRVDEAAGLELTRRNAPVAKRALTADEASRLTSLVAAAKAAPVPAPAPARRIPDAFTLSLFVDGEAEPRVRLITPGHPDPAEGPWMALMAWLDELLAAEIQKAG